MKRALAERAKQSGLPNGVGPSKPAPEKALSNPPNTTSSNALSTSKGISQVKVEGTSSSHRPSLSKPITIGVLKSNGPSKISSASPRSSSSPRPKKRLRESVVKLEEEDEDDANASAFYLRHQNRALASELRQLKYQLGRLENERETRRAQCAHAVQSLNALQVTWTQLETALQKPGQASSSPASINTKSSLEAPLSTGSGTSVELVGALLDSLATLASLPKKVTRRRIKQGGENEMDVDDDAEDVDAGNTSDAEHESSAHEQDSIDPAHSQQLDDLLLISDGMAKRATTLQGWILSLLHRLESTPSASPRQSDLTEKFHMAQQQVAKAKAKNKTLKAQMKELARSRDEVAESDKRVRRGLYRLAAGRVKLKEVLKAMVTADEDKEAAASFMQESSAATGGSNSGSATQVADSSPGAAESSKSGATADGNDKDSGVNSAEANKIKKQFRNLEQVAAAREEQIQTLLKEREEQSKKINNLVFAAVDKPESALSEAQVKGTDWYAELSTKLATANRNNKEIQERTERIEKEWGQAIATAAAAQKAVEDLHAKHLKRWSDISSENPGSSASCGKDGQPEFIIDDTKAEQIITLQHKLTQALENVRQAEATRKTLKEAVIMNESLHAKFDEVRSKYTALQQSRSSGSSGNNHGSSSNGDGITTPKAKSSSSASTPSSEKSSKSEKSERPERSEKSSDKLHREYRRIQKQLAAATASKESAKAKLEKAEKERDLFNSTNARLLKQAAEKDEMNAKSLSTILHLKQLTDHISKEKENLEQQVKSSQQLALAARLAANARERLVEETEKERKTLESRVMEWEVKCSAIASEKERIEGQMKQQEAKMSSILNKATSSKERCEELSTESTKLQEEKLKMMESLAIAQKEASDATKLSERLSKSSGGGMVAGFTAEQLHTQVTHLKNRLHCPVCNVRDKKCILLRCRHMFCKNCVDENIKNRSRKCPACGVRFDTKDVADIWL